MPSSRLHPLHLLWLLLVPLLLWWALRDIRPAEVLAALGRLGLWQIVALAVINALALLDFSRRMGIVVREK